MLNIIKLILNRWICADKRYSPQKIGSNHTKDPYPGLCDWYTNFDVSPSDLECKLLYCVNGSAIPTELNYDSVTIGSTNNMYNVSAQDRVAMGSYLRYNCKSNFYIQNNTVLKTSASTSARVYCEDGFFGYPNPWPECVDDIQCPDPGSTNELIRTNKTQPFNYTYNSQLEYKCKDLRSYVKTTNVSVPVAPSVVSTCQWKKTYNIDGTTLKCVIHHCGHPNIGNGSHTAPFLENNLKLTTTENMTNSFVSFGTLVMYECLPSMFIENSEIDPTKTNFTVKCLDTGLYELPSQWPNCTRTINCGAPPSKPDGGNMTWSRGTENSVSVLHLRLGFMGTA